MICQLNRYYNDDELVWKLPNINHHSLSKQAQTIMAVCRQQPIILLWQSPTWGERCEDKFVLAVEIHDLSLARVDDKHLKTWSVSVRQSERTMYVNIQIIPQFTNMITK